MKCPIFWLVLLLQLQFSSGAKKACPPLPVPEHGKYVKLTSDKVRVECHDSYNYENPEYLGLDIQVIKCKNGVWEDSQPKCLRNWTLCLPPEEIANGIVSARPPFVKGSLVRYWCNKGWELKGSESLVCRATSEWSDYPPLCKKLEPPVVKLAKALDEHLINKSKSFNDGRRIEKNVELHGLDLFLVFDKSSSITPKQFQEAIEFAKFLIKEFNVSNEGINKIGGTRLAIYTFADDQKEELAIDNKQINSTRAALNKLGTIKCINHCDGATNMAAALSKISYVATKATRKKAKKVLFLTSDGVPTINPNLKSVFQFAEDLKKKFDFEIYTVAIGQGAHEDLLAEMSSKPVHEHLFKLKEFDDFSKIMDIIRNGTEEPPPPPPEKCGHLSEENYGLKKLEDGNIRLGSWPWLAAILAKNATTYRTKFACNGVLIGQKWVLTSAQCVTDTNDEQLREEDVYIVLGDEHLTTFSGKEQTFYAVNIIRHPGFVKSIKTKKRKISDDLALIELNHVAELNDIVRTACILKDGYDFMSKPGEHGYMVGWLVSSVEESRITKEPVKSSEAKQVKLEITGCDEDTCNNQNEFMANARAQPTEECNNIDGGSSLISENSRKKSSVIGIASTVKGCKLESKAAKFVRVSYYYDWIRENTDFATDAHE